MGLGGDGCHSMTTLCHHSDVSFSPAWSREAAVLRMGRFVHNRCESEFTSQHKNSMQAGGSRHERGKGLPGLGAARMWIRASLKLIFSHLLEACATTN